MIKKALLLSLVLLFAATSIAAAEDLEGKWAVNANVMGLFPEDNDLEEAVFFGGSLEYNFTSIFDWKYTDSEVENYEHHPRIKFEIAV